MFVLGIVIGIIIAASVVSFYKRKRAGELPSRAYPEEPEEFTLHFPSPGAHGWHSCTVTPSKNTYEEQFCCGGPPTDTSTYEYTIKDHHMVFARLVDESVDDTYGAYYEVVNGHLLKSEIKTHHEASIAGKHIKRLKQEVAWHPLTGSLRYFILSKHGRGSVYFFSQERDRLREGFKALEQAASRLGATRQLESHGGWYQVPEDADEQSKLAIENLQQDAQLRRFGICFYELQRYENIIAMLNGLLSVPQEPQGQEDFGRSSKTPCLRGE